MLARVVRRLRRRRRQPERRWAVADRNAFVGLIAPGSRVLEIGPFASPLVRGPDVRYVDAFPTAQLRERAESLGLDPAGVPEIHFVADGADLAAVDERFDAVVSSHAIEHQPDLVGHLRAVERVLAPGGRYFVLVPDHRYCFDHFIAPSTIAQVLGAHLEGRTRHVPASVLEHRVLTTHNEPSRHWQSDHGDPSADRVSRLRAALAEIESASGYVDVHAWYFTPRAFRSIVEDLAGLGLVAFGVERMFPTRPGANEFWVILSTPED
jgi:SAM-dependent methyltransferase